jgi:hypothetical protein
MEDVMNQFDVSGPSPARRPEGREPDRGIHIDRPWPDRRPQEADMDEIVYVSPPPVPWPRVFPGL